MTELMVLATTFANQAWFQTLPVPARFLSGGALAPRAPFPNSVRDGGRAAATPVMNTIVVMSADHELNSLSAMDLH